MPDWRNPEDYAYTEDLDAEEWAWEFLRRNPEFRYAWERYVAQDSASAPFEASKPFNLREPVDPGLPAREAKPKWIRHLGAERMEEYRPDLDPALPWTVTWEFDVAAPLPAQLELARIHLEAVQRSQLSMLDPEQNPLSAQRSHRDRFPIYLRLLDADLAGASIGEMGRQLFADASNPRRSAKGVRETAREMAASGYLDLLWWLK